MQSEKNIWSTSYKANRQYVCVFFVTALHFKICLIQTILTGALEVWEHHLSVNELDQSAPFLN